LCATDVFVKGHWIYRGANTFFTGLIVASYFGHSAIVQLLLEKDADVDAQGGEYGNALQAASVEGHEQVVKLLLEKGVNVNAQGGPYGNALQAASFRGHKQVVKLLLDKSADINSQGGHYDSAFQAAAAGGHEEVVTLLLEKGTDEPALQAAAKSDNARVTYPNPDAVTDSGYGSKMTESAREGPPLKADIDDDGSVYSALSVPQSVNAGFVSEITRDLLKNIDFSSIDSKTLERIYDILPDHLKALALKVGDGTVDKGYRETMVFICRFREYVVSKSSPLRSDLVLIVFL
jgi:hypothetical protein